ncbi:biotin--protein ligase 1, chloroplastic-like [Macadamia integrifolia]|uniref:biotin--protein ligase 1, chloroplastic-like n=1 Tax=Macadamia integrifolia TaxID=60698 RepID=UPI001C4E78DD|nr:biotin--protein ligase 1, chloroplastic-like [Macadamia integrifolia]
MRSLLRLLVSISSKPFLPLRISKRSISVLDMENTSSSLLILCGKSPVEIEVAHSLKNNQNLKLPDNTDLLLRLQTEIDEPSEEDSFRMKYYMSSLSTDCFGRLLIWSPRLTSTHDVVSHNFCELPLGTVCVADVQFKGRGRSKNLWESPKGCLMFSYTLQMEDGRVVPLLQYVVTLAMAEAINAICDANGLPHLGVRIKWPNDLYLNGMKVGGVLCTSTYKSKKFNVSVGMGLNVDNEKPTICLNAALRELSSDAYQLRKEDILVEFFKKFENLYGIFLNEGFQALEELYCKTWLHR